LVFHFGYKSSQSMLSLALFSTLLLSASASMQPSGSGSIFSTRSDGCIKEVFDIGQVFGREAHTIHVKLEMPEYSTPRQWILNLGQETTGANHWIWRGESIQFGSWNGPQIKQVDINACTDLTTTFDGENTLTLYCNGEFLGQIENSNLNIQNSNLAVAGNQRYEVPEGNFGGCVHYVEVWDYDLSSTEVASLTDVTYECSLNSLHHTLANLEFEWSGPPGLTFTLGHTQGDESDGICSAGHTHCQGYNRPVGVIRTSNGECIRSLNCDGQQEDKLHEYYQNFQCVEKGSTYVAITSGNCASHGFEDIMDVAECRSAAIETAITGENTNTPHRQTENDRPHGCRRQTFGPALWINDKPNSPTMASTVHTVVCKAMQATAPAFWETCRWQDASPNEKSGDVTYMGYACADDEILVGFELSNEGIVDKIKCCSVGGHSSVTDVCSIDKSESDKASCDANKHMVFNGIYDKQDPDAQEDAFVEVLAGKCCEVQCHAKWCGANNWGVSDECKNIEFGRDKGSQHLECPSGYLMTAVHEDVSNSRLAKVHGVQRIDEITCCKLDFVAAPTQAPSVSPSPSPTTAPTPAPTTAPSSHPSVSPTTAPTSVGECLLALRDAACDATLTDKQFLEGIEDCAPSGYNQRRNLEGRLLNGHKY